jgi:hypothetical protein
VLVDSKGIKTAVLCSSDSGTKGCPVYHVPHSEDFIPHIDCIQLCCGDCFPADATVTLASGQIKQMIDLALGDKVAVRVNNDAQVVYEDVYASRSTHVRGDKHS